MQLDLCFFPETTVKANPEFDNNSPGITEGALETQVFFNLIDSTKIYTQLNFTCNANTDNNLPYSFDIVVVGGFSIADENILQFVGNEDAVMGELQKARNLAFNILVGSLREYLSILTARGPWPTFALPIGEIPFQGYESIEITDGAKAELHLKAPSPKAIRKKPGKKTKTSPKKLAN